MALHVVRCGACGVEPAAFACPRAGCSAGATCGSVRCVAATARAHALGTCPVTLVAPLKTRAGAAPVPLETAKVKVDLERDLEHKLSALETARKDRQLRALSPPPAETTMEFADTPEPTRPSPSPDREGILFTQVLQERAVYDNALLQSAIDAQHDLNTVNMQRMVNKYHQLFATMEASRVWTNPLPPTVSDPFGYWRRWLAVAYARLVLGDALPTKHYGDDTADNLIDLNAALPRVEYFATNSATFSAEIRLQRNVLAAAYEVWALNRPRHEARIRPTLDKSRLRGPTAAPDDSQATVIYSTGSGSDDGDGPAKRAQSPVTVIPPTSSDDGDGPAKRAQPPVTVIPPTSSDDEDDRATLAQALRDELYSFGAGGGPMPGFEEVLTDSLVTRRLLSSIDTIVRTFRIPGTLVDNLYGAISRLRSETNFGLTIIAWIANGFLNEIPTFLHGTTRADIQTALRDNANATLSAYVREIVALLMKEGQDLEDLVFTDGQIANPGDLAMYQYATTRRNQVVHLITYLLNNLPA